MLKNVEKGLISVNDPIKKPIPRAAVAYGRQLKIALSPDVLQSLSHVCVRKGAGVFTKWNERLFFPIEAANRGHWMHCGLQIVFLGLFFLFKYWPTALKENIHTLTI